MVRSLAPLAAVLLACAPEQPPVHFRVVKAGRLDGSISLPSGETCGPGCASAEISLPRDTLVTVQARTTNGSNLLFRKWSGVECSGARGQSAQTCRFVASGDVAATAEFVEQTYNVVFASSARFTANLGSARSYDVECNKLATSAGINDVAGDAFVAWMGDANSSPTTLLSGDRGFIRLDGEPITDQIADLVAGRMWNAIALDETGSAMPPHGFPELLGNRNLDFGFTWAWTGILGNGSVITAQTCTNWTGKPDEGPLLGDVWGGPMAFTQSAGVSSEVCSDSTAKLPILCFGRGRTVALFPPASIGKLIFLSPRYSIPPSGGIAAANAFCTAHLPAGSPYDFKALLATTKASAVANAGVQPTVPYVRLDGVIIGTGEEISSGRWRSGAWQFSDGTYPSVGVEVWGGTPSLFLRARDAADTCNDWTDATGSGHIGFPINLDVPFDFAQGGKGTFLSQPCATGASLYCVQQ
jgi:hypothetical protein